MKRFLIMVISLIFLAGLSPAIAEQTPQELQETIRKQCPSQEMCGSKLDPRKALFDYRLVHVDFNKGFIVSFYEAKGDEEIKHVAFAYYMYELVSFCFYDDGKFYMYSTVNVNDEWKCIEFNLIPENEQRIANDFITIFVKSFPLKNETN